MVGRGKFFGYKATSTIEVSKNMSIGTAKTAASLLLFDSSSTMGPRYSYPYDWRGFVGTKKKTRAEPLHGCTSAWQSHMD
jgi:hypothetical protein